MAMGSQFSLSLELTKLVPFGSLVNAAGHGVVRLLREMQASGSDFITEQELAEVFGRNRIEPLFASTFRTAVKHSVIHQVTGIAELIIEGGAGPTVKRSLNEPGYFAMVVQLSLLTYTHELRSLTAGLARAFERRNQGSVEYVAPPRYDALKGVLRAVREQTCGFMWELIISAVERRLYPSIAWTDGSLYTIRALPQVIIQALLDSFTAIQHLPEHTRLQIHTSTGIPTIIVWAHHVLGLSLKVDHNGESLVFGDGPVTVDIDGDWLGPPTITLLNETSDPFFQLIKSNEDSLLEPLRRHPVRDYGTRTLRLREDDRDREESMVIGIVTLCIKVAKKRIKSRERGVRETGERSTFPSISRIISVSKLLFASHVDIIERIDVESILPAAAKYPDETWISDDDLQSLGLPVLMNKISRRLIHTVFSLCMAEGYEEDMSFYIDSLDETRYMSKTVPDPRSAFASLAISLSGWSYEGSFLQKSKLNLNQTSVISAWGWSLCLGSFACQDPSAVSPYFSFIRGVPARGGERRRIIIDGSRSSEKEILSSHTTGANHFTPVSRPQEECTLSSWTQPQPTRYFVGIADDAFEVAQIFSCAPSPDPLGKFSTALAPAPESLNCGFRSMQETSWRVFHTPACEHHAAIGQCVTLPRGVWAFHGFGFPSFMGFPNASVFVGLVAGDSSARWILIANMLHRWIAVGGKDKHRVCVRSPECCFECAIEFAKSCGDGRRLVGLVL